ENVLVFADDFDAGRLEHLLAGRDHVLAHLLLVVAELIMKAQRRNAPVVLLDGIEIDVILVARQHLAEAAHADERARMVAHRLLELPAESRRVPGVAREDVEPRTALEAVAADEAGLLVLEVPEARHVEVAGLAVVERGLGADQLLHEAGDAGAHDVLAEVVADVPARVPDP